MIPLPALLATPLRLIAGIVSLVAIGAGAYFGWRWKADRDNKRAIEAKPAIAANTVAIDTATKIESKANAAYRGSAVLFQNAAGTARANPKTTPEVKACYDQGIAVISKCDSLHTADTTLIALYKKRAQLMEDEAIAARRGKLLAFTLAGGYEPIRKGPTGRLGVSLNYSDNWSAIGTFDQSAKFQKDSTGKIRTTFYPSAFVGFEYHFGGRH